MDNLVIFSNPWITVLIICTVLLYTACALLRKVLGNNDKTKKITEILSYIAIGFSVAIFITFLVLRMVPKGSAVSPEEIFFVFTVISTVALTTSASGRKED